MARYSFTVRLFHSLFYAGFNRRFRAHYRPQTPARDNKSLVNKRLIVSNKMAEILNFLTNNSPIFDPISRKWNDSAQPLQKGFAGLSDTPKSHAFFGDWRRNSRQLSTFANLGNCIFLFSYLSFNNCIHLHDFQVARSRAATKG